MKQDLENKTLLLTGAGGGIGAAVAEKLARSKMNIVLLGGRNTAKLDAVRQAAEKGL